MQDWDLLSSYAGLLCLATSSVYAGSFGSLKSPRKPGAEPEDDDEEEIPDRLSSSDAYMFPIIGSVMLVGLYVIVKYLGTEWINWLLAWYFTIAGTGSVWKCSISVARVLVGSESWKRFDKINFIIQKGPWEVFGLSMRTPSLYLMPFSVIPSALYAFLPGPKKPALLTNLLALSFAHNALSLLKLDTFATGSILLSGLFLYDIWWVFGTEVMVKVATSLDVPIKILWPKSMTFQTTRGFTMLGLGDIVIPGMFVALALRYDFSRSKVQDIRQPFPKPFFTAALFAYFGGLATTMTVMHTFGAAQPALLYLSPACILSFLVTGIARGELKEAWEWKDEPEQTEDKDLPTVTPNVTSPEATVVKSASDVEESAQAHVNGVPVDEVDAPESEVDQTSRKRRSKKKKS